MASGPTIVAKFLADTSQMTDELDGVGSKMKGFGKKAALAIGGAFAIDQVLDFGKASVEAAAADAEAQAKLATTLKNVTGATDAQVASSEAFISNLSKQTAIADDDLRPAMSSLVRGFGDAETAQRALALATDVSAGTGKDLGSVSEALMKAANGSTGALSKMGIEVKNADGSAKSLDQIMSELSTTFSGQAAEAAAGTAGQMRNAQVQFGEFQEQIGAKLLPVLSSLATFFIDTMIPALSSIADWMADNKDVLLAAFIGFAVVVGAVVVPAFIAWAIAAGAAAIATLAAAAPFILIGALIAAVAYLIITNWDNIKAGAEIVWNFVLTAIQTVWNWISENWPLLLAIITGPIGIAVLLIQRNWDTIKDGATAVWQWVVDKWNAIRDGISTAVEFIGKYIDLLVNIYFRWPIRAATEVFEWVSGKFRDLADFIFGIVDRIRDAAGRIASAIKEPINAIIGLWNNLAFQVPQVEIPRVETWFGTVGGGTIGGQRFDFPDLPLLAKGGVLTSPTLFVGGEAGTEIVAPESLLRTIVAEEAGAHYTLNIYPRTADAADIAYGFRRLELMAGLA